MQVRDAGYQKWDCHTPYAMHGMDEAMGLKPTRIGYISFAFGMLGLATAVFMMQYTNAFSFNLLNIGAGYPLIVGGKPPGAFPSMVPIIFELGILLCGLSTLVGLLYIIKLPAALITRSSSRTDSKPHRMTGSSSRSKRGTRGSTSSEPKRFWRRPTRSPSSSSKRRCGDASSSHHACVRDGGPRGASGARAASRRSSASATCITSPGTTCRSASRSLRTSVPCVLGSKAPSHGKWKRIHQLGRLGRDRR